ncbi:MAG TPA: CBS domain-containing protein [Candidatus Limnocylindria bacterium]|nr:CBS domain-containing protein [Candidatus Limnocylindria bacterium]
MVKGTDVWCVEPDATVFDALRRMAEKEVGALVVTEGAQVVGLISEREYARKVVLQGRTSPTTLVKEIMISPVVYIHRDQAIEECMSLITEKRTRHLPVIEDGNLIGLISIGDIVKSIIADQRFLIEQLVRYVSG